MVMAFVGQTHARGQGVTPIHRQMASKNEDGPATAMGFHQMALWQSAINIPWGRVSVWKVKPPQLEVFGKITLGIQGKRPSMRFQVPFLKVVVSSIDLPCSAHGTCFLSASQSLSFLSYQGACLHHNPPPIHPRPTPSTTPQHR